ncbi:MAG: Re/Si-specific NAD(P)(+) transhydrogenase subunit alpha [Bacteroidota bacterium]|nr:Re/Si-specific NAD(P)(+) transhydrogenase subunit alpha [Bacteroidota bacterium]
MTIGILKEKDYEKRIALLPESISNLINLKTDVLIEKNAWEGVYLSDKDYESIGTKIVSREDILQCDCIVMINPPEPEDIRAMKENSVIIGVLNPYFNSDLIKIMAEKNITSFSLEMLPRTTRAQSMDILSSMATVAGYKAVLEAANLLPKFFPMFMTAAGTITPAKVLILGAGVAGLEAVAISRKLGAVVEVFDVRSAVKEEVMSLGAKFIEVEGAMEEKSAGGYAVEQSEEFKQKQSILIQEHAAKSDVVISTAQIPGKKAPVLIKKETVENMKPGSVIIDLAAVNGGNCELTKNDQLYIHNGVKIVGKSSYPSEMPVDASKMYGKNLVNFMKLIINKDGQLNLNFEDDLVKGTCVTHNGEIVNEKILNTIINQ